MLGTRSPATANRRPYDERYVGLAVVHEMHLGRVRHQLIERKQDEIGPVVHEDRTHAIHRRPGRHSHHSLFRQGRVEYTLSSEPLLQAPRRAEHGAWIIDALTQHQYRGVVLQSYGESLVDRARV